MRSPATPRTVLTAKEFLIDLCDSEHPVRKFSWAADVRIARMFWPQKVYYSHDTQAEGWACSSDFEPFSNMTHAVDLVRHVEHDARLTIDVGPDRTRVVIFNGTLQAAACGSDPSPAYAVCIALLNSRMVIRGPAYGYVLGAGLDQDGYRKPQIHTEDIQDHKRYGDILRGGLGRDEEKAQ